MKVLLNNIDADRKAWHEIRRTTVGSSEIAAVVGLHPYLTEFELWAEKTGKVPMNDENDHMWLGTRMEPIVGELFARRTRMKVEAANQLVGNDDFPGCTASPDFYVYWESLKRILEAKTTGHYAARSWREGAPVQHVIQLNWQLAICEMMGGWVAVLPAGNPKNFVYEEVDFSPPLFNLCFERAQEFLELVRRDIPPLAGPGDSKLIAKLQGKRLEDPKILDSKALLSADKWAEWDLEVKRLKREMQKAEDERDRFAGRLLQALGNHEVGILPDDRVVHAKEIVQPARRQQAYSYVNVRVR